MHQAGTRRVLTIVASIIALLGMAAHAGAATITGFADQGIGRTPPAGDAWGPNAHAVATALAGQVRQARYNLAWDFMSFGSGDWRVADFNNWLSAVQSHGLRPLVSFGADGANPTTASYRSAVQAFRSTYPSIAEFTAWNEPNNATTFAGASQAAAYFKALTDVCAGTCTIAAGDFSGNRRPGTYYADYKAAVNALGLAPTLWAYHPYDVVNNSGSDRFDGIARFWSDVNAASSSIAVWYTEVGAFKCVQGTDYGTASQDAAARRLSDLLVDPAYGKASRVYYYHLANGTDCNWDTGLIDSTGAARPALRTLFPSLQPPSATTGSAGDVNDVHALVNGSVDPHGLPTTYRVEYGPTTAYGSSSAETSAGSGTGATGVSVSLDGLSPTTTYHYRIVAANFLGTTPGADQTFTTLPQVHAAFVDAAAGSTISVATLSSVPDWQQVVLFAHQVAAGSSPRAIVWNGKPWIFFVDAANGNTISAWSWSPVLGWQQTVGLSTHAVAAGTSPSVANNGGTLHIAFNDATNGNTITDLVWAPTAGSPTQTPFYANQVTAGSSPSALANGGTLHVFFADAGHSDTISDWIWSPSSLSVVPLYGPQTAAGTSPTAVLHDGALHILIADKWRSNSITDVIWGATLTARPFNGDSAAAGTSPSAVVNNGTLHVLFNDATNGNTITDWTWATGASGPTQTPFYGSPAAAGTSPAAAVSNGALYAFFADAGNGNALASWVWSPRGIAPTYSGGHAVTARTSPVAAVW